MDSKLVKPLKRPPRKIIDLIAMKVSEWAGTADGDVTDTEFRDDGVTPDA
jgi:hypothetical protein